MMNCLICRQAELIDGVTSVAFERGEMRLMVNHVPALVCPSCAEAFVEEAVATRLLLDADGFSTMGIMDAVMEYGEMV